MTLHPDCRSACRRGQDTTPCQVPGGCGTTWDPNCVLCQTALDHGHCCAKCSDRVRRDLHDILRLTCDAHAQTQPKTGTGGSRTVPGSKPPLTVDALDPELTLIRLIATDPSSEVPMLVLLEDWERVIREDRGLVAYGLASEARLAQAGALHATAYTGTVTLTGVIGFLLHHHDWAVTEPTFDLAEYAHQIRLCRRAVSRWDNTTDPPGWRVPCPTVTEHGDCGRQLRVGRGDQHAYCRDCGREWELPRLLAVAGRDADVWVDIEAAATLAGVHEQTIRKWIRRGHIHKRGQLVRVLDVRQHAHTLTAS